MGLYKIKERKIFKTQRQLQGTWRETYKEERKYPSREDEF